MVMTFFASPEEKWLLALAFGVKQIRSSDWVSADHVGIRIGDIQVRGAAACLLAIEAAVPSPSLFPNGNVGMPVALLHWQRSMAATPSSSSGAVLANAELITRQMHDGRPFLQGEHAGLADIASASWLLPKKEQLPEQHSLLPWLDRMAAIAEADSNGPMTLRTSQLRDLEHHGILHIEARDGVSHVSSPLDVE
ncbi:MAG: hypothetical protein JJ850_02350 [Kordiimonadaceae bacterium]|nr:hypothetical protein [Kordiimonadaceae bacterium]MBO6567354.1 hypothetical protein [Kordiimonadaceae bacterium]MBO6963432.1 hypothetical protein [Kordiimonadaceae bacterium]